MATEIIQETPLKPHVGEVRTAQANLLVDPDNTTGKRALADIKLQKFLDGASSFLRHLFSVDTLWDEENGARPTPEERAKGREIKSRE